VKDLPVKVIVNCKNSKMRGKRAAAKKGPDGDEEYDQYAASEGLLSREEVYFTGKENIEGFACLVNVFIRQLSANFDHVAVVNVDNEEASSRQMKQGQLFFKSAVQFKDSFTTQLGNQLRSTRNSKVAVINVKINFKLLKMNDSYRV
jgi:hypothetical protein